MLHLIAVATTIRYVAAFAALSDDELVERVKDLAARERRASVALIRSLVEFDARQLYLREGCSSLFTFIIATTAPQFRAAVLTPLAPDQYC
jgi:hypothetical protein